jgi:hypothetical protein
VAQRKERRTPQKKTPRRVFKVASLPGRYWPFSIDWIKEPKICSKGGRPNIVLDRRRVKGLYISMDKESGIAPFRLDLLELLADIVDGDILDCILIHLLGQVD